jgi:peptide/nickel transport system substrate-binding protein
MDRSIARRLLILVPLFVAGCGPGGDGGGGDGTARATGSIVACMQHLPQLLNPFVSADQASVDLAPLVFTTLVRYAQPGADQPFSPALARDWEWGDDQRILRFRLREDLRWHDGEPVTAADVAWTLAAAADPAYAYWGGADFATLLDVEAGADGHVVLRFSEPFGPGLEPLATLPVLPKHRLEALDPDEFQRSAYHREPVGSGPFIFRRRAGGNQLVFERNPEYPEDMGRAEMARLVVKEIPEVSTLLVELRTGVTDLCLTGPSAARQAVAIPSLEVAAVPPGMTQVLLLDHRSAFFERVEARRAMSAAIDRRSVGAVVSPLASPARTFTPLSWAVAADSLLVPDAAPALADSLLRVAGWERVGTGGGRQDATGRRLEFTLLGPQGYEQVLTVLQDQLARAGFQARPQVMEGSSFIDVILDPDRRPPAMVFALAPSRIYAPDPRSSLHSQGGTNLGSYRSADADAIIDALARAVAGPGRDSLYRALQARVAADVPLVHLLHLPDVVITGPRVEGVVAGEGGIFASAAGWRRPMD